MVSDPNEQKDLSVLCINRSQTRTEQPQNPRRRSIFIGVAAAGVLIAVAVIIAARMFAGVPVVKVAPVTLQSAPSAGEVVLTAGGYIVAHHTIQVSSKIVGKVVWVGVEAGDKVKKGQVLVRLDDSEFRAQAEQARANLAAAQAKLKELQAGSRPQQIAAAKATAAQAAASLKNASLNLKRIRALFGSRIASTQQLTDAESQYQVALAQYNNAQQNFELIKIGPRIEDIDAQRATLAQCRAALDYAQTMLDACMIRSPIDGTVLERGVEVGEMVSNQNFGGNTGVKASVATLANLNDLLAELDINESDFPHVSMHQPCRVTADAYPNRVYKGYVYEIAPEADRQKATIQVKVKIEHPDNYLRPEMNTHVSFLAPSQASLAGQGSAMMVPASAVIRQGGHSTVFVLEGDHVRLRTIQTGAKTGNETKVTAGLDPNDMVVVQGAAMLKSGERVKVADNGQ
jgi:HlyD family secretion protein